MAQAPEASASAINTGDNAWLLISSALVLMMTAPGLVLFYGGLVRNRNVLSTMMHSFILMSVVSLLWVTIVYSASGFVGIPSAVLIGLAGGAACYFAVSKLKARFQYDDSLDVFGVHGIGSTVGMLLVGVLASAEANPALASTFQRNGVAVSLTGSLSQLNRSPSFSRFCFPGSRPLFCSNSLT